MPHFTFLMTSGDFIPCPDKAELGNTGAVAHRTKGPTVGKNLLLKAEMFTSNQLGLLITMQTWKVESGIK